MIKYILFIVGVLFVVSCEKIIDIDLNNANPQLVVEAELFSGMKDFTAKLSYTSSFFKVEEQDAVATAIVSLTKEGTDAIVLDYQGEGLYTIQDYIAEEGKSYTLNIDLERVIYSSTTRMPNKVIVDSLTTEFNPGMFGQEDGYLVFMHYKDDPDVANYYRAIFDLNGVPQRSSRDVYILDDNFTNGSEIKIPLFIRTFQEGDTVDLSFLSLDDKTYNYLLTLNSIIGNGQPSAAPANPNSNFTNNALGYFAIYNGETQRIIIE